MTDPSSPASSPVWHPFTQHALQPKMQRISRGLGAWLKTDDERLIIDAISSWWVITHGHCHPRIVAAIRDQAERLDQVIFAGFSHEPAETLAHKLLEIVPDGLDRVFYSDSGSTAVEVALKMALGYWRNTGQPRTRILALEHAYHGDTVGTMSAGARGVFNAAYEPLLFDVERLPFPSPGDEQATLDALEAACREQNCAALIVEPLVLGAGGMLVWSADCLREMRAICDKYDVLLIADEVMTGWARTGTMFACEQAGVTPDILCSAKGLTAGHLPLAVTLCSERIYQAHYSEDRSKTFFHSSSFTANPISCAAALANIELWEDQPVLERVGDLVGWQSAALAKFEGDERFANIRQSGTIAALDLVVPDAGYLAEAGLALQAFFLDCGILLRPLGNTIYVMPPYCITSEQLDQIYAAIAEAPEIVGAGSR